MIRRILEVCVLVLVLVVLGLAVGRCLIPPTMIPVPAEERLPVPTATITTVTDGLKVQFALLTNAPNTRVDWDFGDSQFANDTRLVVHTYSEAKTYYVKANVTATGWLATIATTSVTVSSTPVSNTRAPAPPAPPAPVTLASSLRCPTSSELSSLGKVEQWLYEQDKLSGAQLSFNQDFGPGMVPWGSAIDAIHQNGQPVPSVKKGTQASVWIVPSCRPLVAGGLSSPSTSSGTTLRCPTSTELQSLGKVEQWLYEQNQLAGAQLSFNQDFGPGNVPWGQAVDAIHQNGQTVPSVKAGTQASVWIVPACRPLR